MHALETIRIGRFVAELHHDTDPESPREWDNLGRLWTFQRYYNSPDACPARDPRAAMESLASELFGRDCPDTENMDDSDLIALCRKRAVILPIYVYEHGNVAYSTGDFGDPWDSGQCGWAIMTKAEILANWGGKILTPARRDKAAAYLKSDVETYSQWASGDVYGYQIHHASDPADMDSLDHDDDSHESCWGYYGYSDSIAEMTSAARNCEAYAAEQDKETAANRLAARLGKLKSLIRARVPLAARPAALAAL